MGTGSSISSIDHNIFQKPYEAPDSLPVGQPRSLSYPPPNLNPYAPPYGSQQQQQQPLPPPSGPPGAGGYYSQQESKPLMPPPYPMQHQQSPYATDNIFYTPPPTMRPPNLPAPYVKQEQGARSGWNYEDSREQESYYPDLGRKRKLSPCEMAYPEMPQHSMPSNCGVPNCTSCPPPSYDNQRTNMPPSGYYDSKPEDKGSLYRENQSTSSHVPNFTLKEEKKETLTTTVSTEGDGYRWRKYGRKSVKGSPYPRSYYKCTFSTCNVKKQVEMMLKDDKMVVKSCIYKGEHNHERPCITFATASNQTSFKNAVIAGFARHEKMLQGTGDVPRLSVETSKDVDFMDDGYRWRKYGQKYVKGSGYPRSYYKCTEKDCAVKKQVDQHGDRITNTYEGVHSHPPCANNGRKRRRCSDVDRLSGKDVKEEDEEEEEIETPPGSSSDLPRGWSSQRSARRNGSDGNFDSEEEEEEEEELEKGRPVKIYGCSVDDNFDEEGLEEDFSVDHLKEFEKGLYSGRQQPQPPRTSRNQQGGYLP